MAEPCEGLPAAVPERFGNQQHLAGDATRHGQDPVVVGLASREDGGVGDSGLPGLGLVAGEDGALARESVEIGRVADA